MEAFSTNTSKSVLGALFIAAFLLLAIGWRAARYVIADRTWPSDLRRLRAYFEGRRAKVLDIQRTGSVMAGWLRISIRRYDATIQYPFDDQPQVQRVGVWTYDLFGPRMLQAFDGRQWRNLQEEAGYLR